MTKNLIFTLVFTGLIFFISSCSKDNGGGNPPPADPCVGLSSKFAADVHPIITTSCAGNFSCHGAGSNNSGGPLTDYNFIFAKRSNIKFQIENALMPKGGSLTADQKNKIICWINSGAPNN